MSTALAISIIMQHQQKRQWEAVFHIQISGCHKSQQMIISAVYMLNKADSCEEQDPSSKAGCCLPRGPAV